MKQFTIIYIMIVTIMIFSACQKDDFLSSFSLNNELSALLKIAAPDGQEAYFRMPSENAFAQIPQDPRNPLSVEKVELGKLLFHETGLGWAPKKEIGAGTYSCASCHFAGAGFQAGRWQGLGEGGVGFGINGESRMPMLSHYNAEELDVQPIRSPSAMNGAWQEVTLWNGQFGGTGMNQGTETAWTADTPKAVNHLGYEGLETQAIAGLEVHRMLVDREKLIYLGYLELFDEAFPAWAEADRYTLETAGLAIAAYERTLLSNQAPFQRWLKGDKTAMSDEALRGALIFFDYRKGNCVSCHTGPALNAMSFHALGMKDLHQISEESFGAEIGGPETFGRGEFTRKSADLYAFKVPQLYNLADSPFYGHGSSFRSIREVVVYKNAAVSQNTFVPTEHLSSAFIPLHLSDDEITDLTIFLEQALYDQNLQRYVPAELPSGNCFPFGDEVAKRDLGCE